MLAAGKLHADPNCHFVLFQRGDIMSHITIVRAVTLGVGVMLSAAFAVADDWPGWRGPHGDNHVTGFTAPSTWPKSLTKKWSEKVGIGESSPILAGDKVYAFGRKGGDEVITCRDAATGKEIWIYKYAAKAVTAPAAGFPGTRSTPVIGEGKLCSLGVNGDVTCVDIASGKRAWSKETKKPRFWTSTSPLIADGMCIVFGDGLTAYSLADGAAKWKWASSAETPYGSPVLMTIDGVKTVVTPSNGALAGIALADGKELWKVSIGPGGKDYFHHYSTPLVDGATVIYSVTGVKGAIGSILALKVEKKDGGFKANELWNNKKLSANQYHTPLLKDGLIYGVNTSRQMFCLDAKTGKQLWDEKTKRGACGSILDAGPVLVELTSDQELVAFKASNSKFDEVAKYKVGADETWSVPILAGNRIYVKDKAGALTMYSLE
jgi:outer membrane protein assembly factor BamB